MTRKPCFEPQDTARVAALPATDPLRVHASGCPRCRALLAAYAAFVEADPGPVPQRDLADANARLSRALAAATGGGGERARAGAPHTPAAPGAVSGWERLTHPQLRPAWTLLTIALVAGGVALWSRPAGHDAALVLRGAAPAMTPAIVRAQWTGDAIVLAWHGLPAADGYEVRFVSSAFVELGSSGPYRDSTLVLAPSRLAFRAAFGDSVLVRVVALKDGDVLATSDARVLTRGGASR